jgi:hypothetical protein
VIHHTTQHGTTFLVFYKFRAMTSEEQKKSNDEWNELKNTLPQGIELIGEYTFMLGEQNIMDSYYLRQKQVIRFLIGGQVLKTQFDGMSIEPIL